MKRKNPFIEEIPRQLKIYVGPKQVAGKEEMKRVHDHTKALLFKGANPTASTKSLEAVGCVNGFTNGRIETPNSENSVQQRKNCVHCQQGVDTVICVDCDRQVCLTCIRHCFICSYTYCHFCSVLNYDQSDVRSLCLSCLPLLPNYSS